MVLTSLALMKLKKKVLCTALVGRAAIGIGLMAGAALATAAHAARQKTPATPPLGSGDPEATT